MINVEFKLVKDNVGVNYGCIDNFELYLLN